MASKVHFNTFKKTNSEGFTILELLLVVAVLMFLIYAAVVVLNPIEQFKKGRDHKRLGDMSVLDRVISEYKVDHGVFPDSAATLRDSLTLPAGSTALANASSGWIKQDVTSYTSKLPLDPINDATYNYKYIHTAETYEINARLEYYQSYAQDDGGSDNTIYEIGNDLTLIVP